MKNKILKPIKTGYIAWKRYTEEVLPLYIYRSRTLVTLYYFIFNRAFKREIYAVLNGKVKHLKEAREQHGNYFLLVRNIHRIEKGLLMMPRRPVFAKAYIQETVQNFEAIWSPDGMGQNPHMKWFYDVLNEYFSKVGSDELIDQVKKRFYAKIQEYKSLSSVQSIPYYRNIDEFSSITFDEFYRLSRQRRSVRWFQERSVPREIIDKAIMASLQSPSACNRQPFQYRVFDDKMHVSDIVDLPMGTTGYGHSIPVMIVIVGNLDAYYNERDRHVIYIDAALAAMSLMFALETLGLGSCAINWPDIERRERLMEKKLKLEAHQRPIMCIGLGYPDPNGMVAFSEKRSVDLVRSYN